MKRALIFGVTGQDGSYLAENLLEKGYKVFGLVRRSATGNTKNIDHLVKNPEIFGDKFNIVRGDLGDPTSIYRAISQSEPDEIYNEADQDHVSWSYDMVGFSADITGSSVARTLEIIKQVNKKIRYFQPCTSNMFGITEEQRQNEQTKFNPQSPYACSKVFAYYITKHYREAYDMFCSNAILYNHESPRRTEEYVTRKITSTIARIVAGKEKKLILGDTNARVDWGYAKEYMECAWKILQHKCASDYVIGTGTAHSVEEFVNHAFNLVNLDPKKYLETNSSLLRPTKTSTLIGDTSKLLSEIGIEPKIKFKELVKIMLQADLEREGLKLN